MSSKGGLKNREEDKLIARIDRKRQHDKREQEVPERTSIRSFRREIKKESSDGR